MDGVSMDIGSEALGEKINMGTLSAFAGVGISTINCTVFKAIAHPLPKMNQR